MGSLGILYGIAHLAVTPTYATNLVQLIGLGIAVDYSLLIVYRFREELARGLDSTDAVVRTMQTAGRAVVFSGAGTDHLPPGDAIQRVLDLLLTRGKRIQGRIEVIFVEAPQITFNIRM